MGGRSGGGIGSSMGRRKRMSESARGELKGVGGRDKGREGEEGHEET